MKSSEKQEYIFKRKMSTSITYELRNICGNPYVHIFGLLLPILLMFLYAQMLKSEISEELQQSVNTTLFGSMAMIMPLAIILLGCAATSAQEIEKNVPLRFKLFGFSEKQMIISRFVAEIILVTIALAIYCLICCTFIKIDKPTASGLLIWLFCFYLLSCIMYMFSYGISNLLKKFGITYCVSMILYFGAMIISGMMGIPVNQMPSVVQKVSKLLPTTYLCADIGDFWKGGSYNFMPLAQSFLFIFAVSGIVLFFSVYKSRRELK